MEVMPTWVNWEAVTPLILSKYQGARVHGELGHGLVGRVR